MAEEQGGGVKIKFSHRYTKLLSDSGVPVLTAKLLQVIKIELDEMSKEFLHYDTDCGLFELPKKGTYLMLIFQKPNGNHLFTTLRRFTPNKFNYYRGTIGRVFNVEYKEPPCNNQSAPCSKCQGLGFFNKR